MGRNTKSKDIKPINLVLDKKEKKTVTLRPNVKSKRRGLVHSMTRGRNVTV